MNRALKQLMAVMPPLDEPIDVDWKRLENAVGLRYPSSFKEFYDVYDGSVWLDHLSPFCSRAQSDEEIQDYVQQVKEMLEKFRGNLYGPNYEQLDIPLYPEKGGLFPFMIDYSGTTYCWNTQEKSPNKWPIICWFMGPTEDIGNQQLPQMLLDWLQREPRMKDFWGDVNKLPPDSIKLYKR